MYISLLFIIFLIIIVISFSYYLTKRYSVFCKNCGEKLSSYSEVCPFCGKVLNEINFKKDTRENKIENICPSCGAKLEINQTICDLCYRNLQPPEEKIKMSEILRFILAIITYKISLIGVWLILIISGLFYSLINTIYLLTSYLDMLQNGKYIMLSSPNSEYYHPLFTFVFNFELISCILLIIGKTILIVLFFMKKKQFPLLFIIYASLIFILNLLEIIFINNLFPEDLYSSKSLVLDIIKASVFALIWIPYMLKSTKVKNTFVN